MTFSCLCGHVSLTIEQRPDFINECNCALCGKSGARWGYFHPTQVTVAGSTSGFSRGDKPDPSAEIHFCPTCGSTTHFTLTESAVAKASQDLRTALENKDSTPDQIKAKLTALRDARAKAKEDLTKAQAELKELITVRQEAVLVSRGMLE